MLIVKKCFYACHHIGLLEQLAIFEVIQRYVLAICPPKRGYTRNKMTNTYSEYIITFSRVMAAGLGILAGCLIFLHSIGSYTPRDSVVDGLFAS